MSLPRPWYRASKRAWYLQVSRGVQKRLGKTRAEADAPVELADGAQPGVTGELTLRRLDDEWCAEEIQDLRPQAGSILISGVHGSEA